MRRERLESSSLLDKLPHGDFYAQCPGKNPLNGRLGRPLRHIVRLYGPDLRDRAAAFRDQRGFAAFRRSDQCRKLCFCLKSADILHAI